MELTPQQIILYTRVFGCEEFSQLSIENALYSLDPTEAVKLACKYNVSINITPFIGKTWSSDLLHLAIKQGEHDLVQKCLYVLKDSYSTDLLYTILNSTSDQIVYTVLDYIEKEHINIPKPGHVNYKTLCTNLRCKTLDKFYTLYKDDELLYNVCQYSDDETFEHFYNDIKDLSDCFIRAIKGGHLERVERLIHLYGKSTEFDMEYNREFKLDRYENWYISGACASGNTTLVKYLMGKRTTPENWVKNSLWGGEKYTCPYIENAASSGNKYLVRYLFNSGYKIGASLCEYHNFTPEILELLLQRGKLDPLMYSVEDGGAYDYSFQHLINGKMTTHLLVLKNNCKPHHWDKIIRCILESFDECFIPLIDSTSWFEYARDEIAIEHMMDLGVDITRQQWVNLYVNLLGLWNYKGGIILMLEHYTTYIDIDLYFEILEKVYIFERAKPIMKQLFQVLTHEDAS
jgi:hypothetical protein